MLPTTWHFWGAYRRSLSWQRHRTLFHWLSNIGDDKCGAGVNGIAQFCVLERDARSHGDYHRNGIVDRTDVSNDRDTAVCTRSYLDLEKYESGENKEWV